MKLRSNGNRKCFECGLAGHNKRSYSSRRQLALLNNTVIYFILRFMIVFIVISLVGWLTPFPH